MIWASDEIMSIIAVITNIHDILIQVHTKLKNEDGDTHILMCVSPSSFVLINSNGEFHYLDSFNKPIHFIVQFCMESEIYQVNRATRIDRYNCLVTEHTLSMKIADDLIFRKQRMSIYLYCNNTCNFSTNSIR